MIAAVLIVAAVLCAHLDYFNVDGIAVVGNENITDEEIIKQSGIETGGSVFDVHPFIVQHRIKKNLYIDDVNVNRKLPDKVEIIVKERSLLAQFRMDDRFVITDSEGMVLDLLIAMNDSDLYFKKVVFNGAKTEAYVYDELKCSGRYDDLMSAISSGTLKKVIYDLYQKGTEEGTVNVYSNDYCFFTPK